MQITGKFRNSKIVSAVLLLLQKTAVLIEPHKAIEEPASRRQAQLTAGLALALAVASTTGFLITFSMEGLTRSVSSLLINSILSILAYIFSKTKYSKIGSLLLISNFIISGYYIVFGGAEDAGLSLLTTATLSLIIGSSLLSILGMGILTGLVILLAMLVPVIAPHAGNENIFTAIGMFLTWGIMLMILSAYRNSIERDRFLEIRRINSELLELQESLEQRVESRTNELNLASELGQILSQLRDRDELLNSAVDLIQSRFNLYYVQIYLVDADQRNLVLYAGSGNTGKRLKRQGHRLLIDTSSLNGRAAFDRKPVVIADTTKSLDHRPNPLLPNTRSEICIPLVVEKKVIGVLDIQGSEQNELTEEKLPAYTSLAGQLAIAIDNMMLYQQQVEATATIERQSQASTLEGWDKFLDAIEHSEHIGALFPVEKLIAETESITEPENGHTYETAIELTGLPIGTIVVDSDAKLPESEIIILDIVSEQIARQVENLRLISEAERYQNEAESVTRQITREGWQSFLNENYGQDVIFEYDHNRVRSYTHIDDEVDTHGLTISEPLRVRDAEIGELVISGLDSLSEDTQEMVSIIAERLSSHLENIRLNLQTQEALSRTETLYQIGQRLQSDDELDTLVEDVLLALVKMTGANYASYIGVDYQVEKITHYYRTDIGYTDLGDFDTLEFLSGSHGKVLRERHSITCSKNVRHSYESESEFEFRKNNNLGSTILVPVHTRERIFGLISLVNYTEKPNLSQADLDTAEAVAGQLAVMFENRTLFERAQSLAQRERNLRQITSKVRSFTDPSAIAQTTTQELHAAINRRLVVEIETEGDHPQPTVFDAFDKREDNLLFMNRKTDKEDNANRIDKALKLRGGDEVGTIRIYDYPESPLTDEDLEFVEQVADQVALALESARLFLQTQNALAETEVLYNIIADLNAAENYGAILEILSNHTILENADQSLIMFRFDQPLRADSTPEWIIPISILSDRAVNLADHYPISAFESVPGTLFTKNTIVLENVYSDNRLDRITRTLFSEVFSARSSIIIPLILGDQSIGFIMGNYGEEKQYKEAEIKRLSAIASQVAISVQGMQLLDQTKARARREQLLREFTNQVNSAVGADAILRRAAEQAGKALKRPVYVYLGDSEKAI